MEAELITALVSLAGSLIGAASGMKVVSYRLSAVEKKLDSLASLPSRIESAENKLVMTERRVERLEDMRGEIFK